MINWCKKNMDLLIKCVFIYMGLTVIYYIIDIALYTHSFGSFSYLIAVPLISAMAYLVADVLLFIETHFTFSPARKNRKKAMTPYILIGSSLIFYAMSILSLFDGEMLSAFLLSLNLVNCLLLGSISKIN